MFTGLNLKTNRNFSEYKASDKLDFLSKQNYVKESLDSYINKDSIIDGTKLQEDWFPSIKADVFLSHSHADEELAIGLAGWLKGFGIETFIDSMVWGYSDDLMRKLNNHYCKTLKEDIYWYDCCNRTASHVHMMLSTALYKMIDKTECIIFLNTEGSINLIEGASTDDIVKTKTFSPWIYSEILATELVRKKKLSEYRDEIIKKEAMESIEHSYKMKYEISYDVDLTKLTVVKDEHLERWERLAKLPVRSGYQLDNLYKILGII